MIVNPVHEQKAKTAPCPKTAATLLRCGYPALDDVSAQRAAQHRLTHDPRANRNTYMCD